MPDLTAPRATTAPARRHPRRIMVVLASLMALNSRGAMKPWSRAKRPIRWSFHFSQSIAGSVKAAFDVFIGVRTVGDCLLVFLVPTVLGNTIWGVAPVALLNHAPLATEA